MVAEETQTPCAPSGDAEIWKTTVEKKITSKRSLDLPFLGHAKRDTSGLCAGHCTWDRAGRRHRVQPHNGYERDALGDHVTDHSHSRDCADDYRCFERGRYLWSAAQSDHFDVSVVLSLWSLAWSKGCARPIICSLIKCARGTRRCANVLAFAPAVFDAVSLYLAQNRDGGSYRWRDRG